MPLEITRAPCPECGPYRNVQILAEDVVRVDDDPFGPDWYEDRYRIIACMGCGMRFFQHVSTNADNIIETADKDGNKIGTAPKETKRYWPPFQYRKRPSWQTVGWTASERLAKLTDEMYAAYHSDLSVLTAIGIRTVFDCATEELGIDPGGTFEEKLNAVLQLGKIGVEERAMLGQLVNAGSAAAHRGWQPSGYQITTMLNILEGFLHRAFVLPDEAKTLDRAPPRPRRS